MRFFRNNGNQIDLNGIFKDQTIFFIGGGPSFSTLDHSFFLERGICSFAVNNVAAHFIKPTFWCCSDDPRSFHSIIWQDPTIIKFCPYEHSQKFALREGKGGGKVYLRNVPNLYFFNKVTGFNHESFLTEEDACWGNEKHKKDSIGERGCRSVMLLALKIIYSLGFRRVFLLGCDFNMEHDPEKVGTGKTYSFPQYKHPGGVLTNNFAYKILNKRFEALRRPFMEQQFHIFNCTEKSGLTAFPTMDLEVAKDIARATLPSLNKVNTFGYYGGQENLNRFGW